MDDRYSDPDRIVEAVRADVAGALMGAGRRCLLAVSGGLDSTVLLDAACANDALLARVAAVATFDHGTGAAATRAARAVRKAGRASVVAVVSGRAPPGLRSEEEWREARWRFLRAQAAKHDARIVTAHTRDDQLETVVMRAMRGAGARGLAALYAPSDVLRPLLAWSRAELLCYAAAVGRDYVEDPSNRSRRHFRNRVRLDLLPAMRRADPAIEPALLDLSRRAAAWRSELEAAVDRVGAMPIAGGGVAVPMEVLDGLDASSLQVLWPALAARGGVRLDRRGIERLARFTGDARTGDVMQLSGGWEVVRFAERLSVRRTRRGSLGQVPVVLAGELRIGDWHFRRVPSLSDHSPWSAALPADQPLTVRAWQAGDRMLARDASVPRRVKRFFRDVGVIGPDRDGWPVVLAGSDIVWIPGVRRSDAATARPGMPAVFYACDRESR